MAVTSASGFAEACATRKSFPPVSPTKPWIGPVARKVLSYGSPKRLENGRGPREVDAPEVRISEDDLGHGSGVPEHEIDHPGGEPGFLEEKGDEVVRVNGAVRRLPEDRVAHHRGRAGEVPSDRGEVERRDGIHEAVERPIVRPVPDPRWGLRLLQIDLLGEVRVESVEVDQLARGVDLSLVTRLALPQHRGRVEGRPPMARQEVRRREKHGCTGFPRPRGPLGAGLHRRLDGGLHLRRSRLLVLSDNVPVIVWDDARCQVTGANFLASDDQRDLDFLAAQLGKLGFEDLAFGISRAGSRERVR